jgi:hypothetical protein
MYSLASLQVQETEGEKGEKREEQDTANWLKGSHAGRERETYIVQGKASHRLTS